MTILRWLIVIELVGFAGWPFCFLLFRGLPDAGLGLSRILGALVIAYAAWLSASMGLFPYDPPSLYSFLILFILAAGLVWTRHAAEMRRFLLERKQVLLFEQGLFLALFAAAALLQAYKPDITLAEKEADMMFLQSVLHGRFMPPEDLWFCGKPVNYYYFGYAVFGALTALSGVRPEFGFNLAVITVLPLACLGAFSLAYNLTRSRRWALLAPFFLFGLGNLDAFVRAVRGGGLLGRDWWYEMFAHGSREVIPGTIHEFPLFSFLLGDLHPHYMFMPFCFLLLSMLLVVIVRSAGAGRILPDPPWLFILAGSIALGTVFVSHTWDYPGYLFLAALGAFLAAYHVKGGGRKWPFAAMALLVIAGSAVLFLPFRLQFQPAAKAHVGLVDPEKRSPLAAFLTLNGLGCLALFGFLADEAVRCASRGVPGFRGWALAWWAAAACAGAWIATGSAVAGSMAAAVVAAAAVLLSRCERPPERLFVCVLALYCAAMYFGCELFYLKDFYAERLHRQNTVFKFYFQSWILCALIFSAGGMFVARSVRPALRIAWIASLALLVAPSLIYPIWGTYHRCQRFRRGAAGAVPYLPTLDGMAYIRQLHPSEYRALQWIRRNVPYGNVILEATGDPYSFFGRVATFAGRPTVLGWGNQESLWRDWSWRSIQDRTQDIARMYDEGKKESVMPLLRQYGVRYVYVGTLEAKKYKRAGLDAFARVFSVAYRNREVTIYRVQERI